MKIPKGNLNKRKVFQATVQGKQYTEQALLSAKKLSTDEERTERLNECLCLSCFYLRRVRIGGAAMTSKECATCDTVMQFSSTATDMLCPPCAKENALCKRCGADIELKQRRKPYPFEALDSD